MFLQSLAPGVASAHGESLQSPSFAVLGAVVFPVASGLMDLMHLVDFRLVPCVSCGEDGRDGLQALCMSKQKPEAHILSFFNLPVFLGSSVDLSSYSVILSCAVVSLLRSPSRAFFISVAAYLTSRISSFFFFFSP